jgi:hemolysin activation/secretion protein
MRRRANSTAGSAAVWTGLLVLSLLCPFETSAQVRLLPGDERPEPPKLEPQQPAPRLELPPLPSPPPHTESPLTSEGGVFVRDFRVAGSTVFSAEELAHVTAPWSGRRLRSSDLVAARDAISQHYIQAGYVTSGAVIPDQRFEDGIVRIQVTEGTLADVIVTGTDHFRPHYFRSRLLRAARAPVNVTQIEEALQLLQRSSLVERIHADLAPGTVRGESILRLRVHEASRYRLSLESSNEHSPSVGSIGGSAYASFANAAGLGDRIDGHFDFTEGLRNLDFHYALPMNAFDTTLRLRFRYVDSDVVDGEFEPLDISAENKDFGIALEQPVYRSLRQELRLRFGGEYREGKATLLGSTCLGPRTGSCKAKVSVLRFSGVWTWSDATDALAARSQFSVGIDALGSDSDGDSVEPDSRFFAWLGQAQWVHRLPEGSNGSRLLARFDVQLADDPLPAVERFAVGGMRTVRGYPENALVRDNGYVGSVELQVPVLRDALGRDQLALANFIDVGRSWRARSRTRLEPIRTLSSVGLGLLVTPRPWFRAELYWAHALRNFPDRDDTLQDNGFHFRVSIRAF